MEQEINKDYICAVVQNEDSTLSYKEVPIENPFIDLENHLKQMVADTDKTLYDMQLVFMQHIPKPKSISEYRNTLLNYYYPVSYFSSYVDQYISYPISLEENEENYNQTIHKYEETLKEKHYSDNTYNEELNAFKKRLKSNFKNKCDQYLLAKNYTEAHKSIKQQKSVKIYSSEPYGFFSQKYNITDDITIILDTNFCYGTDSSFFYLKLYYKDIEILPYTDIVTYFYARMADFIKYTKSYQLYRISWSYALKYITEIGNISLQNPNTFIENYIIPEIKHMMSKLEDIYNNPQQEFKNLAIFQEDAFSLLCVRNISSYEKKAYLVYPDEASIAFQAEKISSSLYLLYNLQKLIPYHSYIQTAINQIRELNSKIEPTLTHKIQTIEDEINKSKDIIAENKKREKQLQEQYDVENKEIEKIFNDQSKNNPDIKYNDIRIKYREEHPAFKQLHKDITALNDKIEYIRIQISYRNTFIETLQDASNRIREYLNIS